MIVLGGAGGQLEGLPPLAGPLQGEIRGILSPRRHPEGRGKLQEALFPDKAEIAGHAEMLSMILCPSFMSRGNLLFEAVELLEQVVAILKDDGVAGPEEDLVDGRPVHDRALYANNPQQGLDKDQSWKTA